MWDQNSPYKAGKHKLLKAAEQQQNLTSMYTIPQALSVGLIIRTVEIDEL